MSWHALVREEWESMGYLGKIGWLAAILPPLITVVRGGGSMLALSSLSQIYLLIYPILIAFFVYGIWRRSKHRQEELELFIKPLYLAFEKYPTTKIIDMLSYPPEMWKSVLVRGTFGDAQNKKFPGAEDTVNSMINIMSQHRELAQPKLQETIDQFLAMRRDRRERKGQYAVDWHPYYDDAVKVINEIAVLVRERYDALTSKKM